MKDNKINIKIIVIVVLIGITISLILINLNYKNSNIEKQELIKEQLTEATSDNAYVDLKTHFSEMSENKNYSVQLVKSISYSGTTNGTSVNLSDVANYNELELYKNLFIVPTAIGYYLKDERNGHRTENVYYDYNSETGTLKIYGTSSGNYYGVGSMDIYIIN